MIGDKYHRLTIISEPYQKRANESAARARCFVKVKCDCNKEFECRLDSLKREGNTMSCGCYNKEVVSQLATTHGLSDKHTLYQTWLNIRNRCKLPCMAGYEYYGGRGIKVCDEWQNDFMTFFNWAMANGWEEGLTIDRFPDMNGNYEPNNCRFATRTQQARNTRSVRLTEQRAKHIRLLYSLGSKNRQELSFLYGVATQTIDGIIQNRSWL